MEESSTLALDLFRAGLALIVVVGLMFALSLFLRKLERFQHKGVRESTGLKITHLNHLDPKRRLSEIEWRGQTILLMTGPHQDIVVAKTDQEGNNKSHDVI